MSQSSSAFIISRLLGITTSAFLSGFAFSCSYLAIPALSFVSIPQQLAQWQKIYDLGKFFTPPVAGVSSLLFGFAAWQSFSLTGTEGAEWKMYTAAGVATLGTVVWTVGAMMPTNKELMNRAKIAGEVVEGEMAVFAQESSKALKRWDTMNYIRSIFPLTGAVIGLVAALNLALSHTWRLIAGV